MTGVDDAVVGAGGVCCSGIDVDVCCRAIGVDVCSTGLAWAT